MYIVKSGSLYLASDGTFVENQSGAQRFDTATAADDAIQHSTPRRVKLTTRADRPATDGVSHG